VCLSSQAQKILSKMLMRRPNAACAISSQSARCALGMGFTQIDAPTLLTRRPNASCTVIAWSAISCGARLRAKPPLPVAQNEQRMGQPT
jgi:hypothetical protein